MNKKDALIRLSAIENETKELRRIIDTPEKIQDRIKTLKDVYGELNINRNDIIPFKNPNNKWEKSVNAGIDIQCISEVLNQGASDPRYYPYFKKGPSGWVVDYYNDYSSFTDLGLGFYFSSSELALYAGNQFIDVYTDWLP